MKVLKWQVVVISAVCTVNILFYIDKFCGESDLAISKDKTIEVEVGDIIFRTKSYFLSNSKYYYKSGMPGHLAIVISEGKFNVTDKKLGGIDVVESALYNRYKAEFQSKVAINKAFENFGSSDGKRFLLKMHLSGDQKLKLIEFSKKQIGKPYRIFASKDNMDRFNCATFVRKAILDAAGFDLDSDDGFFVFPNDILNSSRFYKPENRIRF